MEMRRGAVTGVVSRPRVYLPKKAKMDLMLPVRSSHSNTRKLTLALTVRKSVSMGGVTPWNPISSIPRIVSSKIDNRAAADGKINVSIKVEAQNRP